MFVTTGHYRHTALQVDTFLNGAIDGTQSFSLLPAFTVAGQAFPAVTTEQLQRLSDAAYALRVQHFKLWVESQVKGLAVNDVLTNKSTGSSVEDGVLACADNR